MSDKPRCDQCAAYQPGDDTSGECRAALPLAYSSPVDLEDEDASNLNNWPIVSNCAWCRHFVPLGPTPLDVLRKKVRSVLADMDKLGLLPLVAHDETLNRLRRAVGDL